MLTTVRVRRNPDVIAAEAAGETILLNAESWTYLNFNETASWLWGCLDEPRSLAWLVAAAEQKYETGSADITRDVEEFLLDVSTKGFVLADGDA